MVVCVPEGLIAFKYSLPWRKVKSFVISYMMVPYFNLHEEDR